MHPWNDSIKSCKISFRDSFKFGAEKLRDKSAIIKNAQVTVVSRYTKNNEYKEVESNFIATIIKS